MARPTIDDKREPWIKIRANAAERHAIRARCAASGLTMSEYIRSAAMHAQIIQRESIGDKRLLIQLAAAGNNLNQLARSANISGSLDPVLSERLRDTLSRLETVMDALAAEC